MTEAEAAVWRLVFYRDKRGWNDNCRGPGVRLPYLSVA